MMKYNNTRHKSRNTAIYAFHFFLVWSGSCIETPHTIEVVKNRDTHHTTDISRDLYQISLRIIDKTGKSYLLKLTKGQATSFKTLIITAHRIIKNRKQDPDDVLAYIEIEEYGQTIFRNWLSAANPAVNMLEHPLYLIHINFS